MFEFTPLPPEGGISGVVIHEIVKFLLDCNEIRGDRVMLPCHPEPIYTSDHTPSLVPSTVSNLSGD